VLARLVVFGFGWLLPSAAQPAAQLRLQVFHASRDQNTLEKAMLSVANLSELSPRSELIGDYLGSK